MMHRTLNADTKYVLSFGLEVAAVWGPTGCGWLHEVSVPTAFRRFSPLPVCLAAAEWVRLITRAWQPAISGRRGIHTLLT
jgi:hypothetical protein